MIVHEPNGETRIVGEEPVPESEREHYVVVADDRALAPREGWLAYHTRLHGDERGGMEHGPLVWETYLGQGTTLQGALDRAASLRGWGNENVRIARLEFLPDTP